ncbi:MAG: dihydrofolate reductase family protein [Micrococcaceae bacterium]
MDKLLAWNPSAEGTFPIRAAMVSSLNGYVAGTDGTSNSITNNTDRNFFLKLRNSADIIIVGAETVRSEQYKTPRNTAIVVVTESGIFPSPLYQDLLNDTQAASKIYLCTPSTNKLPASLVQHVASSHIIEATIPELCTKLRELGFQKILCEGGITLLKQLIDTKSLNELLLTIVPQFVESQTKYHVNFPANFEITSNYTTGTANILKLKLL